MFSSLILGLLLAGPAPALAQVETISASAQTSSARSAFRSDFDQRVARIRTDLAVHGNVQLQVLRDLARDLAVTAEAAELESLWLELILLAESVADQRGDRELALRWLDPANAEHPVIAANGELKPDRVALLAQAKQQVAGRPELKARLASWGPAVKLEPLFSFEQAWERTSQVYGAYEGSISQLRSYFEPDSSDAATWGNRSLSSFDLRDAPGLYYLVLEGLGRDRNWPGHSPLVALNHVDPTTSESLVEELLFCGYPEWTQQLLDLWLAKHVEPWRSRFRGNLMAGLLDDALGRRAVLPNLADNLQAGQFSAPLAQRLQILMAEDPAVLEAVYGSNHGIMPASSRYSFYPDLVPLAALAVQSDDPTIRRNAAGDLARMPNPEPMWTHVDASDSHLHATFVESLLSAQLGSFSISQDPRAGQVSEIIDRPAADPANDPVLAARVDEFVTAMSSDGISTALNQLAYEEVNAPLALYVLNATLARDDFASWTKMFNFAFFRLVDWGYLPDIELAAKRFAEDVPGDLYSRDFQRVLEDLTARNDPAYMAWAVEFVRRYDYSVDNTWIIEDLVRYKHDDPQFLKRVVSMAGGLSGDVNRGGSLFLQIDGASGAAIRELVFAEGLTPVQRLTAWCLGWDAQASPPHFMRLIQRPDMLAAFEEHRANSSQGQVRTTGRGDVEYILRLDQIQDAIGRWYRDGRFCDDEARSAFHQALLSDVQQVDPRTLLLVEWRDNRELGPKLSVGALSRLLATPYEDDPTALVGRDIAQMSIENLRKYAPDQLNNSLILQLLKDPFTVGATVNELQKMPTREEWLKPLADLIREDSAIGLMPYTNDAVRDRVRVQVVQLLERLNSLEAAQVLLEFDQFQNTTLSKEVNAALSRMRERFATREAFANWNNQQRQRAQTIAGLAALLDAKEPDQRVAAIQSLGALSAQEYLPDLILLFADEDPSVAAAARKAVRSIQDALERELGSSAEEARDEQPEGDSE
ncbi:MAG: hypothetical protein ACYS26_00270 [Planctomycetota bacterium]|jgi:hypothetical protein